MKMAMMKGRSWIKVLTQTAETISLKTSTLEEEVSDRKRLEWLSCQDSGGGKEITAVSVAAAIATRVAAAVTVIATAAESGSSSSNNGNSRSYSHSHCHSCSSHSNILQGSWNKVAEKAATTVAPA